LLVFAVTLVDAGGGCEPVTLRGHAGCVSEPPLSVREALDYCL
jgi:hypothetical protein